MRDFLDNLIDRHADVAPQIKPRLPSIFEPAVSRGGLDLAVKEEATPPGETETLRQPPRAAQPVGLPTVAEPVRPIASPAPTVPVEEEKPSVKVGLNKPVFSLSPRETPTLPPPLQRVSEESAREPGLNEGFPKPSVTLIAPVMGRVRHAHQEERMEHTSPNLKATAKEQPPVKESLNRPVFSLSPRETPTLPPPLQGRSEKGVRGLNQGLLNPSTPLIAPVIPSMAGPERPVSRPEPVINVTIGRIEVRATVSPQRQTPKPESRTPVMGLEEYLRRRSGGQDR
jgi:hypothetical protein